MFSSTTPEHSSRTSSLIILSPWLLSRASAADFDIKNDVCDPLDGLVGCTGFLVQPYGATSTYCTRNEVTSVCGIQILTSNINVCTMVRDAMGLPGNDFLAKAKPLCQCVPFAINMAKDENFYPIYTYGAITQASSSLVSATEAVDKCIVDGGLLIESNREKSVRDNLQATDGWKYSQGADITVDNYNKLIQAVSPCWFSDRCDSEMILQWYRDYHALSSGITDGELLQMLNNWLTLYNTLKTKVADVSRASKTVQERLAKALTSVSAVKKSRCTGTACSGSIAKSWLGKVSNALTTVKNRQDIGAGATKATTAITSIDWHTRQAIESTKYLADEGYLRDLFANGQVTEMSHVVKGFRVVERLPKAAIDIKKQVVHLILLTKHLSKVKTAQAQLNDVLATNWKKRTDLFKTPSSIRVRDGLIQMQGIMKKELNDPLNSLAKALQSLDDTLNQFPLRKQNLELQSGAVKYRRWNLNSFDVPCASRDTKSYTLEGYTDSVEYTKVEVCHYGPTWYYLPSHHIPYIKWRFYA